MPQPDFVPLLPADQNAVNGHSPRKEATPETGARPRATLAQAHKLASEVARTHALALLLVLVLLCVAPMRLPGPLGALYRTEYRLQAASKFAESNDMTLNINVHVLGVHVKNTTVSCVETERKCCLALWQEYERDDYKCTA